MSDAFRYDVGDLVRYQEHRWTEEFREVVDHVGIVIDQRYCFSTSNRFKVRTATNETWVSADHIVEILSPAQ